MRQLLKICREQIRLIAIATQKLYYVKILGMNIHPTARISWGAHLDKTYPKGVHIGANSYVASGALILTHDYIHSKHTDTIIGSNCFIGANAIIMSGLRIGNHVIIGGGSVVTKNVPDNCIVAGNPAKIIKERISTTRFGRLK